MPNDEETSRRLKKKKILGTYFDCHWCLLRVENDPKNPRPYLPELQDQLWDVIFYWCDLC